MMMNYRRIIGISCGCIATTAVVGLSVMNVGAKNSTRTLDVALPNGGIANIFSYKDNNTSGISIDSDEVEAGITPILKNYYTTTFVSGEKSSIKGIERILKTLPDQSDEIDNNNSTLQVAAQASANETEVKETKTQETEPAKEDKTVVSAISGYTVLGVANVSNYLNVREEPNLDGNLLGKLPMNAGCEILETLDGWYKIKSGEVEGYVAAEFLLTGEQANERAKESIATVALIKADKLMVREEPNTECQILTKVAAGEEIEVSRVLDGWVEVNIDNEVGYVCAEYVQVYDTLPKGVTMKELSYGDGLSSTAVDLIEYAKQFLGNPYVWGGTSLTNGADCSGFTMRIFEHFGYSLSRTSRTQAYDGRRIDLDSIKPGDLLFYNHGSSIGHVAIYIGNGQIIHASTERTGIIIGNAYYATPACAVRILE